jgi:hypothetical protein
LNTTQHHHLEAIDIVYLWVNGADPVWQEKRRLPLARTNPNADEPRNLAKHGDVAGRYRDNEELRFNLRALEKFFPQHGHIFIVTDGQAPTWLQASDRISLIDHLDLIPKVALPVFDSGHIESYLHHIPNLSEKFIYLNDDVFFGAEVKLDEWFGESGVAVYKELAIIPEYDELQPHETALVNASIMSKQWLSQRYPQYQHAHRIFAHAPRPMFKSVLRELEALAPELFDLARQTVFRSWQAPPLVADLVPRWMLHTGLAKLHAASPVYICTGDTDAEQQFNNLIAVFGELPFFCINDTSDDALDDDPQLQRIRTSLEKILPLPSAFEKA